MGLGKWFLRTFENTDVEELLNLIETLKATLEKNETEKQGLQQSLDQAHEENLNLHQVVADQKKQIDHVTTSLHEVKERFDKVHSNFQESQNAFLSLKAEYDQLVVISGQKSKSLEKANLDREKCNLNLKRSQERIAELNHSLAEEQNANKENSSTIASLKKQNQGLNQKNLVLISQKEELEQQLNLSEERNNKAQTTIDEQNTRIETLLTKNNDIDLLRIQSEEDNYQLQLENKEVRSQLQQIKLDCKKSQIEVTRLQKEKDDLISKHTQLINKYQHIVLVSREHDDLMNVKTEKLKEMEQELIEYKAMNEALTHDNQTLDESYRTQEEKLKEREQELFEYKAMNEALTNGNQTLDESCRTKEKELKDAAIVLVERDATIETLTHEKQKLNEIRENLEERLNEVIDDNNHLTDSEQTFKTMTQALEEKNTALMSELNQMNIELKNRQNDCEEQLERIAELNVKCKLLEQEKSEYTKASAEQETLIESTNKDLEQTKMQLSSLVAENDQFNIIFKQLNQSFSQLSEQKERSDRELLCTKKQLELLTLNLKKSDEEKEQIGHRLLEKEDYVITLTDDNSNLLDQNKLLDTAYAHLMNEYQNLQVQKQELEKQISSGVSVNKGELEDKDNQIDRLIQRQERNLILIQEYTANIEKLEKCLQEKAVVITHLQRLLDLRTRFPQND